MSEEIRGVLEIDHERGVIYFHTTDPRVAERYGVVTILRVCSLPVPVPNNTQIDFAWGSTLPVYASGK